MILCPFPDKKRITQWFGENAPFYAKYGLKGHSGIDFAIPVDTPICAPHEGYISQKDNGVIGYGKHVQITSLPYKNDGTCRRSTLAHLSRFYAKPGSFVSAGDLIGYSGNTGDSTGPHLHWDYRLVDRFGNTINYNNGYNGCIDLAPLVNGQRKSPVIYWPLSNLLS